MPTNVRGGDNLTEHRRTGEEGGHKNRKVPEDFSSRTQSGREDSNLRPLDPQSSALTRLRYAPGHRA